METILLKRINDLISKQDLQETSWFLKNQNVTSISQSGPQCGIVALCMALNHLNIKCSVDGLMNEAKQQKFTKSGEIFDIEYLRQLGIKYYPKCRVVQINDASEVYQALLHNKLVLIAYDCDLNFEPCNKNGLKAHWALITGIIIPIDSTHSTSFEQTEQTSLLIHQNHVDKDQLEILKTYFNTNSIYTICRQGKSKHYGVWNFQQLIESNKQLKDIDHVKCDDENFIKPLDGDLQKTLANKFLIFE